VSIESDGSSPTEPTPGQLIAVAKLPPA